jgi:CheY-like chemotaxis protein
MGRELECDFMPVPDGLRRGADPQGVTVLLVEDDPRVRAIAAAMLAKLGYRVLSAVDGPGALTILATDQPVDLLFTDYVLPRGMNGADLAERARRMRPGLRVLHTSGYTERRLASDGRLTKADAFIPKPYALAALDREIRNRLDSEAEKPQISVENARPGRETPLPWNDPSRRRSNS